MQRDETLYLVCGCGEVFDTIETANDHDNCEMTEKVFTIAPESEAF